MRKKWIVIIILFAILAINPNRKGELLSLIGKKDIKINDTKKIEIGEDFKSTIYDAKIVYHDGKNIKSIDEKGESLFELNLNSNNSLLQSNKYIDVLDKENNIAYSINKNGKIIFKKSVPKNGIIYKSLKEDLYVYCYEKGAKNILNFYDNDYTLINSIEIEGAITDIDMFENYIYVVELNTAEYLGSNIYKYDYNGNLKKHRVIDDSVVIGLDTNKDTMTLVSNNNIETIDGNLETKDSKEIKDIKLYSNTYKDNIYIVQEDDTINLVDNKSKKLNIDNINAKGIINNGTNSIIYNNNKIITTKNKLIKEYKDTIERIYYIKDDIYVVKLDKYIEILEIN
ncbi:MAG: hypothetical protein ACRC1Y_01105 [Paraclostridium sp.]